MATPTGVTVRLATTHLEAQATVRLVHAQQTTATSTTTAGRLTTTHTAHAHSEAQVVATAAASVAEVSEADALEARLEVAAAILVAEDAKRLTSVKM